MLNIFHFSIKPPYPLKDGGCIAIADMLGNCVESEVFNITHFTLATHKHPFDKKKYPESLSGITIESTFIATQPGPLKAMVHLIKNNSYHIARFYNEKVVEKINTLLDKSHFDVALFESIYLLPYLSLFKKRGIKVVLRTHNVEHQLWHSITQNTPHGIKKWYLSVLVKQLKAYELKESTKLDGIIAISKEDAHFFKKNVPNVPCTTIPTSFSATSVETDYSLSDFYFLGAMDWQPNRDGINWLIKNVLSSSKLKNEIIHIAGKNLLPTEFQFPSIKNHGEVPTALTFIQEHGICVIPLLSGGGIKMKLLENMAIGKPIITTKEGIRGINVNHRKEVLIAQNTNEFISLMNELKKNQELRENLGKNAKKYIATHYNKKHLINQFVEFLQNI